MGQLQFRSDDTIKWVEGFGDGSDGDLTISGNTTEAPIDASCTATAGNTSISATNASFAIGQIIMIHKTRGSTTTAAGTWELNKITNYSAGTITTKYALQNAYQDSGADQSQVRVLKQYNNVTVNNGVTYTAKAWGGDVGGIMAFCAKGTVTVTGNITASGKGYLGNTVNGGNQTNGRQGEGTAGAGGGDSRSANGNGGGGGVHYGSAPYSGGGGGGGNGAAGSNGTATSPGTGGSAVGVAALTTISLGGGGGSGGNENTQFGAGGNGAGITLILAADISITGTIVSTGANGANIGGGPSGNAGGGSGGSTLIKARTAVLGTNLVTAAAGAAGTGGGGGVGGAGGVGRIHLDYKTSYTGTTTPTLDYTQDATLDYPPSGWFLFF